MKFIKSLLVYKTFFLPKWKAPFPFNLKIFQLHPWKFYEIYQVLRNAYGDWGWWGAFTNWQFHSSNTSKYPTSTILETLTIRYWKYLLIGLPGPLSSPSSKNKKIKKCHSEKISKSFLKKTFFLYFGKWNFLTSRLKAFRMELSKPKKWNKPTPKKFFVIREMDLPSPKLKKALIVLWKNFFFLVGNLQSPENIDFLYFGELNFGKFWELSSSQIKKIQYLIFFIIIFSIRIIKIKFYVGSIELRSLFFL